MEQVVKGPPPQADSPPGRGAPGAGPTIRDVVDRMARLRGDAPFLIQPRTGATVTFAQLQRDSRALTGRLSGWGLLKGDRVALLLENGPCVAELLIGTLYAGLVPVPLSIHAGHRRIVSTLEHSGSRALFMAPGQQARLESDLASDGPVRLVRVDPDHRLDRGDDHVPTADLVELEPQTLAPAEEPPHGPLVGHPGVRVRQLPLEELLPPEPRRRARCGHDGGHARVPDRGQTRVPAGGGAFRFGRA